MADLARITTDDSLVSKGPVKLVQRVKIAHSFLNFIILSFAM